MKLQIIETIIVVLLYLVIKVVTYKSVERTIANHLVNKGRGKIIRKIINLFSLTVSCTIILIIWGVDQTEVLVFVTSILAVLGIALFAQWSILSNITCGLIIFFNHSVRLEDTVVIMDKDYEIEGRISDIGLFFVTIKNKENEPITIPNNVFLQKMIKNKGNNKIS